MLVDSRAYTTHWCRMCGGSGSYLFNCFWCSCKVSLFIVVLYCIIVSFLQVVSCFAGCCSTIFWHCCIIDYVGSVVAVLQECGRCVWECVR